MPITEEKDVLRLFVTEAAFLSTARPRQLGFDTTPGNIKAMLRSVDGLSIAWSVSDDSLQALEAKANAFSALNTFNLGATIKAGQKLTIGTLGEIQETASIIQLMNTNISSKIKLGFDTSDWITLDGSQNLIRLYEDPLLETGVDLLIGAATLAGKLSYDTGDVVLQNLNTGAGGDLILNSQSGDIILKGAGTPLLSIDTALDETKIETGTVWLNNTGNGQGDLIFGSKTVGGRIYNTGDFIIENKSVGSSLSLQTSVATTIDLKINAVDVLSVAGALITAEQDLLINEANKIHLGSNVANSGGSLSHETGDLILKNNDTATGSDTIIDTTSGDILLKYSGSTLLTVASTIVKVESGINFQLGVGTTSKTSEVLDSFFIIKDSGGVDRKVGIFA